MDNDLKDLFGPASKHRLTVVEREHIWKELRSRSLSGRLQAEQGSWLWRTTTVLFRSWTPVAAAVVILVLTGTGAVVAEDALPGDFLYPVKRMREQLQRDIQISTQARAEVETKHMVRRLDEADALEQKGTLSEKTTVDLDNDYRRDRRSAVQHIQTLETEGSVEAAAQLRARLNAAEDRYERLFKGKRRRQPPESGAPAAAEDQNSSIED